MSIRLTAYREADEPARIKRLREVAADCPASVLALHDHKGTLAVNWLAPPSLREVTAVVQAWAAQDETGVDHFVCGMPYDVQAFARSPFEAAAMPLIIRPVPARL
jgi:hypothetical protein